MDFVQLYVRQLYVQQLVANNFAKNRENYKGELCLNVITPFIIIVVVLQSRDVPKTVIRVTQNGGAHLPSPPVATALMIPAAC